MGGFLFTADALQNDTTALPCFVLRGGLVEIYSLLPSERESPRGATLTQIFCKRMYVIIPSFHLHCRLEPAVQKVDVVVVTVTLTLAQFAFLVSRTPVVSRFNCVVFPFYSSKMIVEH